jgi:hypothetical protein
LELFDDLGHIVDNLLFAPKNIFMDVPDFGGCVRHRRPLVTGEQEERVMREAGTRRQA